jgi:predicted CXXCH cytochrome family protein
MAVGPRKHKLASICFNICRRVSLNISRQISFPGKPCRLSVVISAVLFFAAIPSYSAKVSNQKLSLHHFDSPCETCHSSASMPDKDNLISDISTLCSTQGCHNYDPMLNHAVDIVPGGQIPADMPLDSDQRITCLTCHDSPVSEGNARMLQKPQDNTNQFCAKCHSVIGGSYRTISHWQFSNRAHLETLNPNNAGTEKPVYFQNRLDRETQNCLACHDEVKVTIPSLNESESQKRARWASMTDHPVGVDYSDFALQKSSTFFYPRQNPERVRLFDGKVGCGSCHSPYASDKKLLNETFAKGRICTQCHNR